jgi:hypothetical protein
MKLVGGKLRMPEDDEIEEIKNFKEKIMANLTS